MNRTYTDSFPWSDNGVHGYYGLLGTVQHELGHAIAGLDHVPFTVCSVTNPIMVSSLAGGGGGRWQLCGQWGLAADDVNGVDYAY